MVGSRARAAFALGLLETANGVTNVFKVPEKLYEIQLNQDSDLINAVHL
jgi:hypothetical protein